MTIDKSWTGISNRNSPVFIRGLKAFLKHCKPLLNPISKEIACPCNDCGNSETGSLKTLWQHISQYGFDPTYTIWDKHGETLPPVPPPVVHNPLQPPSPENDNMAAFLDEVIRTDNQPTHSDKKGVFRTEENERIYGEMKAIQKAIKEKKMDPKTDREIIDEVLKSHNRGHIAGVGRVVPGTGSNCRSPQADQAFCTREEVEEMKKKHAMELEEQRKAFESRDNLFKQFLDFYNSKQGTPTSQFQIPNSYTPIFPGSTYTRGGPTTTHSDPLPR